MELAVVTDEIKQIDPNSIVLPDSAVEGATSPMISEMKKTTAAVKTNFIIAGKALASSAEMLSHLKGLLPSRTWGKYIESGALPFSKKTAQDLVNSWEWIRDFKMTDGDCCYISTRALNRIANASPEAQALAASKAKAGGKITESVAKELIASVTESDMSAGDKQKVKKNLTAAAKLDSKDSEIEKLKNEIAKLKKENSALRAQANAKIESFTKAINSSMKEAVLEA